MKVSAKKKKKKERNTLLEVYLFVYYFTNEVNQKNRPEDRDVKERNESAEHRNERRLDSSFPVNI